MALHKQCLNIALSTLHNNETGYFVSGQFADLTTSVALKTPTGARLHQLERCLNYIHQDMLNMETIALRLAWQKDLYTQGHLNMVLWVTFAASDIEHFHVEFRSLFDYLAKAIRNISDRPGQVTDKGFKKLRNSLDASRREVNAERHIHDLGEDLARFVLSCEWFGDLKQVRESVVHSGGFTLVFPTEGRILFQVYEKGAKKVLVPEIMFNANVVDFELYAGLYIGYLIAYLEDFSELARKRLDLEWVDGRTQSYHPGLRVVQDWIKQVLSQ